MEASVNHFNNLFKEDEGDSIAQMVRLTTTHPLYIYEEKNYELMEEVIMEKLKEVVHSMQRDKSLGPDDSPTKFSLVSWSVLKEIS